MELSNMEFAAIKKRLSNSLGKNKSNTGIKPGKELPFMIVFSDLPDNLEEFAIEVAGSISE
jgi:pilus assembly protein FimV